MVGNRTYDAGRYGYVGSKQRIGAARVKSLRSSDHQPVITPEKALMEVIKDARSF